MRERSDGELRAYRLDGLAAEAEILVDRWGIPHIYAQSAADAFFVQGFNAARDRLWQIDLWRRRGLGLLAAAFGRDYVERDRAARLFLYRGAMEEEWNAYGESTQLAVRRFCAGVNAFVELTRSDPGMLPVEFVELGYLPDRWAPEDILRIRTNGRHHNVESEVTRALVLRDFGAAVERLRTWLEPDVSLVVPEGLELSKISHDVLRLYRLATAPFDPGVMDAPDRIQVASAWGSNNWAIAGNRTASGRPILANDPHRALTFPSLRYIAHVSAPGVELIGAGEPGVPGVAVGHNGCVAFGVTTFTGDQEDLFVYELNAEGTAYRYEDGWERFAVVHETVEVRDEPATELELCFSRHGPVVAVDLEQHAAFAVRAAWLEAGMAPYLGALGCLEASRWEEFSAAAERWGYPGDNLVYADTQGTIAWKAAGRFPVRRGWDGLLPVPGDGRFEWDGFHGLDALPALVDPAHGWVASANHRNVDEDTLRALAIGCEWLPPYRYQRIAAVLSQARDATVGDSLALQADCRSLLAERVVAAIAELCPTGLVAAWAWRELQGWDGDLGYASRPGAIFEVWFRLHLARALLTAAVARLVPTGAVERAVEAILPTGQTLTEPRPLLDVLERPDHHLGTDGRATLKGIVEDTLAETVATLERLAGPDRNQWSWGVVHRAQIVHPAAKLMPSVDADALRTKAFPRGGSVDTVGNTAYARPDFRQTDGCSFRVVLDVGDWDRSVAVNFPGQSGELGHRHQQDLATTWASDEAFPLLFTRPAVEEATNERIALLPLVTPPQG